MRSILIAHIIFIALANQVQVLDPLVRSRQCRVRTPDGDAVWLMSFSEGEKYQNLENFVKVARRQI